MQQRSKVINLFGNSNSQVIVTDTIRFRFRQTKSDLQVLKQMSYTFNHVWINTKRKASITLNYTLYSASTPKNIKTQILQLLSTESKQQQILITKNSVGTLCVYTPVWSPVSQIRGLELLTARVSQLSSYKLLSYSSIKYKQSNI